MMVGMEAKTNASWANKLHIQEESRRQNASTVKILKELLRESHALAQIQTTSAILATTDLRKEFVSFKSTTKSNGRNKLQKEKKTCAMSMVITK